MADLKRRRTVPIRFACFCALLMGAVMPTHAQENQPQYADQLYSQAKWRQAAAAYETFASENPDYTYLTRIYMRIGQAYGELEELEKARKAYAKGVEAGPDDSYIYSIISLWGNMYIRRYQYAEAQTMCENLIRSYPNTIAAEYAQYSLGTYLELGGAETAKSAAAYESFIKLYPNSMYFSGAVSRLTSLLIQSGEAEKAEALLMERLGMSPNNANLLDQLAEVYQQQGRSRRRGAPSRKSSGAAARRLGPAGIAWRSLRRKRRPGKGARGVAAYRGRRKRAVQPASAAGVSFSAARLF